MILYFLIVLNILYYLLLILSLLSVYLPVLYRCSYAHHHIPLQMYNVKIFLLVLLPVVGTDGQHVARGDNTRMQSKAHPRVTPLHHALGTPACLKTRHVCAKLPTQRAPCSPDAVTETHRPCCHDDHSHLVTKHKQIDSRNTQRASGEAHRDRPAVQNVSAEPRDPDRPSLGKQ